MLTQMNRINPMRLWEFLSRLETKKTIYLVQIYSKNLNGDILKRGTPNQIREDRMFHRKWKDLFVICLDLDANRKEPILVVEEDNDE